MDRFERKDEIDINTLRLQLEKAGINISQWGTNNTKTLEHLQKEIEDRETTLITDRLGNVLRKVMVGGADIYYISPDNKKYRLKEEKQIFKDGRERRRDLEDSVCEKMKLGEDPKSAIIRGIREELGINGEITLTQTGVEEEKIASPSYPGLKAHYVFYKFQVILTDKQFNADGYIENQPDKSTYFIWEEVKHSSKLPLFVIKNVL